MKTLICFIIQAIIPPQNHLITNLFTGIFSFIMVAVVTSVAIIVAIIMDHIKVTIQ